jgi:gamma-glutamyltranspeptidase
MKPLLSVALLLALLAPSAPRAASRAPVRAASGMVGSADEIASAMGIAMLK